jgi:hypothetical protein
VQQTADAIARAVAIYAAAVSTVALLWNIRRDLRDRGNLRVQTMVATDSTFGRLVIADQIAWSVVNSGRRPVFLNALGGFYRDGRPFALALAIPPDRGFEPLPRKLEPGQRELVWTVLPEDPHSILRLAAWDTEGHIFYPPSHQLRQVLLLALQQAGRPPKLGTWHKLLTFGPRLGR